MLEKTIEILTSETKQGEVKETEISLEVLEKELLSNDEDVSYFKLDPEEIKDKAQLKKKLAEIRALKKKEAEKRRKERDTLIINTLEQEGEKALTHIYPLSLEVGFNNKDFNINDKNAVLRDCMTLKVVVNPLFDAVMQKLGATKRGKRTYVAQLSSKANIENFIGILHTLPSTFVYSAKDIEKGDHKKKSYDFYRYNNLKMQIKQTPLGKKIQSSTEHNIAFADKYYKPEERDFKTELPLIQLEINGHELFIKIGTASIKKEGSFIVDGTCDLNLMPFEGLKELDKVSVDNIDVVIQKAKAVDITANVSKDAQKIINSLDNSFIVRQVAGEPGNCYAIMGTKVQKNQESLHNKISKNYKSIFSTSNFIAYKMQAKEAKQVYNSVSNDKEISCIIDNRVQDIIDIQNAKVLEYESLFDFQYKAVAMHLATNYGYLNLTDTGGGKTYMGIEGCRQSYLRMLEEAKAQNPDIEITSTKYLALVAGQKSVVGQWLEKSQELFSEAETIRMTTTNIKAIEAKIEEAYKQNKPLVIVTNYNPVVKAYEKVLSNYIFDNFLVDEIQHIKNHNTQRGKVFWALRDNNVKVCVGLTGTPIDKNIDDLGKLIAYTRNDRSLLSKNNKLSKNFNLLDEKSKKEFWNAVSPVLFRLSKTEFQDKMPSIHSEILLVDPTKAELNLSNGARTKLREFILKMNDDIESQIAATDDEDILEILQESKDAFSMQNMHGTILGGVTVARKACEPRSLESSNSVAVSILEKENLIAPAIKSGGTKRKDIVEMIGEDLESDPQNAVLVFTDFVDIAELIRKDLADKKIRVQVIDGSTSDDNRDLYRNQFQGKPCAKHKKEGEAAKVGCPDCGAPELDVLVLTKAAKEGLNLQRANILVHFELSWVPSDFLQRVGRVYRLGSHHEHIKIVIALMVGTIEERVAAMLVPRAMKALIALDETRDIDISKTELGNLAKQLSDVLSEDEVALLSDTGEDKTIIEMAKKLVLDNG